MRALSIISSIILAAVLVGIIEAVLIWSTASEPTPWQCMDEMTREQVRTIVLAGIDQALKNQTTHLFEVWMKDSHGQPMRANSGMRNAINAYSSSRAIGLRWMPPICSENPRG
jgi:hypothetical protein